MCVIIEQMSNVRNMRGIGENKDRLILLVCGAMAAFFLLPGVSAGFEIGAHYYLRFGLSLSTCFDWDEAHLIASGDWALDENGTTMAEMNPVQTRNKIEWHAFGHSDRRFYELWQRSLNEPDLERRLVKLGQFMHFLEDWEAHAGYGIRMGHARDTFRGRDPDSLGNSFPKNHRMVQSALDHLLATCENLGRLDVDRDIRLIEIMNSLYADALMDDLFEAGEPNWKRRKLGTYRSKGPAIKAANKDRVERLIVALYKPLAEKNIPADFAPGPETGIPPSLRIPFDRDGNIISKSSIKEAMRDWAAASDRAADVTLSIDDARIYYRRSGKRQLSGWALRLSASNQGDIESVAGQIEIVVIDSDDETVLAQTSDPLPVLQPGETQEFRINIAARKRPEPDVIIASFARVGDLSAMNDFDWLMLGDAEEEEPDAAIVTDLDPPPVGTETVRFLHPPRTFVIDDAACILVTAYTSGGDSPQKLDQAVGEVLGGNYESYYFRRAVPGRWSALSTDEGLVAGKTFECYEPDPRSAELIRAEDPTSLRFAVTLEAEGSDPYTEEFPMDPDFVRALLEVAGSVE